MKDARLVEQMSVMRFRARDSGTDGSEPAIAETHLDDVARHTGARMEGDGEPVVRRFRTEQQADLGPTQVEFFPAWDHGAIGEDDKPGNGIRVATPARQPDLP